MENDRLKSVSLFSGAGGMDEGVKRAGFDVLLANDIDRDACETYRLNHGKTIIEGSIRDILPQFSQIKGIDLVFGGPPCQGFSVAGRMDPNDPRSAFMSAFFDAVEKVRPAAFICENVKALAALERWKDVRSAIMDRVKKDYHAELIVLKASDYGVPQNRERMFIVGIRKSRTGTDNFALKTELERRLAAFESKPKTVGEIIRQLGPAGSQGNQRVCSAKITFAKSPVLRKSPYAGMLFNGAGRPFSEGGVAPTLPASMGGNKTPIVDEAEIFDGADSYVAAYHAEIVSGRSPRRGQAPSRLRRLTIDECLAIQSFPPTYELSGSRSAMYRQIGNAVPCDLAFAVASVTEAIIRDRRTKRDDYVASFIPRSLKLLMDPEGALDELVAA